MYTFLDYLNPHNFWTDSQNLKKFLSFESKLYNFQSLVGKYYSFEIWDWHCQGWPVLMGRLGCDTLVLIAKKGYFKEKIQHLNTYLRAKPC